LFALDRAAAAAEVSHSAPMLSLQLVFLAGAARLAGDAGSGRRALVAPVIILAAAYFLWLGDGKWRFRQAPGPWARMVQGKD
jgi:hypothetical protein